MIAVTAPSLDTSPNREIVVTSYIVASANTRSSLTDEDARLSLDSFEQANAVAVADHIACSLTHSVRIGDALGVYAGSSENSFLIETDLEGQLNQYLASLLGRYAHQEFVLFFAPQQNGPDRIWTIESNHSLPDVVSKLRISGLVPATVRQENNRTEVLFVDFGSRSTEKLTALASHLDGRTDVAVGVAAMPGSDNRYQAAAIFDANIRAVEQKRRYKLSSHLWSKSWRDATSRTCSKPISSLP